MIRRTFLSMLSALPLVSLFCKKKAVGVPAHESNSLSDFVMESVGQASMCWEHPERAGVFDDEQAIKIGNGLRQHFADGIGDFATARRRVCDDLSHDKGDEGLRIGYQSNIAMTIMDSSVLNHEASNQIADRLMNLLFETNYPLTRGSKNEMA